MQPFNQYIAAAFVLFGNVAHALLIALECRNRRHLQRRKGAVIVIAFDSRQGTDQRFVADHKADTPARHVVTFRQRKELDRHIACTRHLHD